MRKLVSSILNRNLNEANSLLEGVFHTIMEKKLLEMKKMMAAKMYSEMNLSGIKPSDNIEDRRQTKVNVMDKTDRQDVPVSNEADKGTLENPNRVNRDAKTSQPVSSMSKNNVQEEEQLDEARVKIVTRVRGGKVQRRKKLSNVEGMTLRGGKLTRMSPAERRRRKMGARKAKVKRKAKRTQMLMKRKRSLMRRRAMGL